MKTLIYKFAIPTFSQACAVTIVRNIVISTMPLEMSLYNKILAGCGTVALGHQLGKFIEPSFVEVADCIYDLKEHKDEYIKLAKEELKRDTHEKTGE